MAQAIEASLVVLETKANVGKSDIADRGNLAPTRDRALRCALSPPVVRPFRVEGVSASLEEP